MRVKFLSNVVNVSDSIGNFQFLFNGFRVFDKSFNLMQNGDSLTLGVHYNDSIGGPNWFCPAFTAINWPGEKDAYAIIQQKSEWDTLANGFGTLFGTKILFSKIDMKQNNGLGAVTIKNQVIAEGKFIKTAACRHANGRDWWLLIMNTYFREYVSVLFGPNGVESIQRIPFPSEIHLPYDVLNGSTGDPLNSTYGKAINTTFNKKGDKFLFSNQFSGIYVFDFDRCSGQLGTYLRLDQDWWMTPDWATFSPSGRFIYSVGAQYQGGLLPILMHFYQFDLEAANPQASRTVIAENDDYKHPILPSQHIIGFPQTAPDGKMYASSHQPFFHTIEFPDRKGAACKFKLRNIEVPFGYSTKADNYYYPNYLLGPIDGTACDSLGLDNHPLAEFRWDIEDTLSPLALTFTDLSSYEPATWSWDFGDPASGASNMSSDTSPVHTFSAEGIYEVCLIVCNVNSCDTICKTVILGDVVPPTFQANFGFVITNSQEVAFTDQSQTNPISWSWNFGDGATSTEQHPTHIYTQAGTYTACLVACDALGVCDTFCLDVVVETVGLDENLSKVEENLYTIFPNPVQNEVYIYPKHKQNTSNVVFLLYDITGRAVFSEKLSKNHAFWKVNLGGLVEGLYFYEIKNDGGVVLQSGKVVKQR